MKSYITIIFLYIISHIFILQIEEAVETGIEEAEKIIEDEMMEGSGSSSGVEDEIFGDEQNKKSSGTKKQAELTKEIINLINDNDEPSRDIDLGSVQEV